MPQNGAVWAELASDQAEVRFPAITGILPIRLWIDADGNVTEIHTDRWSDANSDKVFRLQPFGGRMKRWQTFEGFSISVAMEIGNFYGTKAYVPFFKAITTQVEF